MISRAVQFLNAFHSREWDNDFYHYEKGLANQNQVGLSFSRAIRLAIESNFGK